MSHHGVAVYHPKFECNLGTLWRSAVALGASWVAVIGPRFKRMASDTVQSWKKVPVLHYQDYQDFKDHLPYACQVIGVEINDQAVPLEKFEHPSVCCYLLGAEDHGLPGKILSQCQAVVQLPGSHCLNVAVAGSIVLYDRVAKETNPCLSSSQTERSRFASIIAVPKRSSRPRSFLRGSAFTLIHPDEEPSSS